MTTDVLELIETQSQQTDPALTVNEALRQFEGRTVRVLSRTTDAQPADPSEGDTYIITGSATGADWSTYAENDMAHFYSGVWQNWTPIEGVRVWVNDEDELLAFDGSVWGGAVKTSLLRLPHLAKSADYTVTVADLGKLITVDSSGGAVKITLPTLANAQDRSIGVLLGTSGNNCVVEDNGGTTLFTLSATDEFVRLSSDGSAWRLIAKSLAGAGSGDVVGPTSSVDNEVPRFDGTGGKTLQRSGVKIDDDDNIYGHGTKIVEKTANFTLAAADKGKTVECKKSSAFDLTVPDNATVPLPVGYQIDAVQTGSGQVTFVPASGVTIQNKDGTKISGRWGGATLYQRAIDIWVLIGDLTR